MKLHPLSIPYRIGESLLQWSWLLFVGLFVLPGVVDGTVAVVLFGLLAIGLVSAISGWEVAYHRRYEYDLTEDTFDIDSGVLSRRSREIPYGRVQNVSINRNVVQRALGLAEVRLETAGGSETEAHLRFVDDGEARRLQDELSERKRTDRDAASDVEVQPSATERRDHQELLFEITPRELSVLGLVSLLDPRIVPLVLFALAPFQTTIFEFVGGQGSPGLGAVVLVLVVLGAYLATAVVRALYGVANYYGFRLVRGSDELRYDRGLLQQFSGTIPLAKVQALTLTEHVLARLAGYAALSLETAGFSPGEAGGSQAAIPIARRERALDVARRIEPVELPAFERPPKRARERYVARYAGVVLLLAGVVYALLAPQYWIGPWYWPLGLLAVVPVAAHLKWRHLGYALTDDYVVTRHGFWRRTTKIVPYHRVQTVADTQTIFQRRRALATLHVDVAGSHSLVSDDSRAVDIDRAVAAELRETVAERMLDSLEDVDRRGDRRALLESGVGDGSDLLGSGTGAPSDSGVPGPD